MEEKITLLDKKILNELNHNTTASFSEIAKKIRSSKEVVNYRIKRLEKIGIIQGYITSLGLDNWANKILLSFSKINVEKEKEIIKYLKNQDNVNWVTSCSGDWDLVFVIMAKDMKEFDTILRKILTEIGEYISNYKTATSIDTQTFGHTYILNSIKEPKKITETARIKLEKKDKEILKILRTNARARLIDIHTKTKIPVDTIKYRIKRMEKDSIIKGYRLILDTTKLGYNRYEIFLRCLHLSDKSLEKIKSYAKSNPNIEFFSKCVGSWDIEFTLHLTSSNELRNFILKIKKEFGEEIQKIEIINLFETHNFSYFPKEFR